MSARRNELRGRGRVLGHVDDAASARFRRADRDATDDQETEGPATGGTLPFLFVPLRLASGYLFR